jgi:hypothetical protein
MVMTTEFCLPVSIDNVILDGIYYDWIVYHTETKIEEKQCYMVSFAKDKYGNYKKERNPFISITFFNSKNAEEISIFADYQYKIKSAIYLGFGGKQFRLFTEGEYAWTKSSDEDRIIIQNLLEIDTLRVRGETITGEYTIDTYKIKGMARAYKRIHELCKP